MYIYKKLSLEWKNFLEQKVFLFRFYILCENFNKENSKILRPSPNIKRNTDEEGKFHAVSKI